MSYNIYTGRDDMKNLCTELNRRIVILDGAMGSEIISQDIDESKYHLNEFATLKQPLRGCYESLCVSNPDIIENIHTQYLLAGADIIETNTCNANALSLQKYGLSAYDRLINLKAVQIARKSVEHHYAKTRKEAYVAGAIGPGNALLSDKNSKEFQALTDAYFAQASAIIEGEADLLFVETIIGIVNAQATYHGIRRAIKQQSRELPIICSAVVDDNGRLIDGSTLSDFVQFCIEINAFAVGLNCGTDIGTTIKAYQTLTNDNRLADKYLILFPSAGLPDNHGRYRETAPILQQIGNEMNKQHINIVGGCCGTGPAFIKSLSIKASVNRQRLLTLK